MFKDKIDIYMCLCSLLHQERIIGLARGHTKTKSWSLVVNHAQKSIIVSFNKMVKILPRVQKLNKIVNDSLQKFSTAEKNRKSFRHRERSKIGKDCQHTWKDLSGTTSWERLVVP